MSQVQNTQNEIVIDRGIGRKLTFFVTMVYIILGLALVLTLVILQRESLKWAESDQVNLLAESYSSSYALFSEEKGSHYPERIFEQVRANSAVLFLDVLDHQGQIVRSSEKEHIGQQTKKLSEQTSTKFNESTISVTYPMHWNQSCVGCHSVRQNPVGAIRLSVQRDSTLHSVGVYHYWAVAGVLVICLILAFLTLKAIENIVSKPLYKLAKVMNKAAKGDRKVRFQHNVKDEIGSLAEIFNDMISSIHSLRSIELEQKEKLFQAQAELLYKDELQHANSLLEIEIKSQQFLIASAHELATSLNQGELLNALALLLKDSFEIESFMVWQCEGDTPMQTVFLRNELYKMDPELQQQHCKQSLARKVVSSNNAAICEDIENALDLSVLEKTFISKGSLMAVPMESHGEVIGVLEFFHKKIRFFDQEQKLLFTALASQLALALSNSQMHDKMVTMAVRDSLTGLHNRRSLMSRLKDELVRAKRFSMPVALLMIDVDNFKMYNDRLGHLQGDKALIAVAKALESMVRRVDFVTRYGGEEFCIVLPRADLIAGAEVAEKLCEAVRDIQIEGAAEQPLKSLTISIGLAIYPNDLPEAVEAEVSEIFLLRADKALYHAKSSGRNCYKTAKDVYNISEKPDLNLI